MSCFSSQAKVSAGRHPKRQENEEEHSDILKWGLHLQSHGKSSEAKSYITAAVEARRQTLSDSHPSTIAAVGSLGLLLQQLGEKEEALVALREAAHGWRSLLGDTHHKTQIALGNLADLLKSENKWTEVRELPGYENASRKNDGGFWNFGCGNRGHNLEESDKDDNEGDIEEEEEELDDDQKQDILEEAEENLVEAMAVIESANPDMNSGEGKRQALRDAIVQAVAARYITKDRVESGVTIPGGEIKCVGSETIAAGTKLLRFVVSKAALAMASRDFESATGDAIERSKPNHKLVARLRCSIDRMKDAISLVGSLGENDKVLKEGNRLMNNFLRMEADENNDEEAAKSPEEDYQEYVEKQSLTRMLGEKIVCLVKPDFFIDLQKENEQLKKAKVKKGEEPPPLKTIPKRQDIPEEYFLDVGKLTDIQVQNLQIISLSYCWFSNEHPDPHGYHLATIAGLLKCFMKGSQTSINPRGYTLNAYEAATAVGVGHTPFEVLQNGKEGVSKLVPASELQGFGSFCFGGEGIPVGIFMDWTSIHQGSRAGDTMELFNAAMEQINFLYTHRSTIVWTLNYPPQILPRGGKNVKFERSGWMSFEKNLGEMISPVSYLLNINDDTRKCLLSDKVPRREPNVYDKKRNCLKKNLNPATLEAWRSYRYVSAGDYAQLCLDTMNHNRTSPLVPKAFKKNIEDKDFMHDTDNRFVATKYNSAFSTLFTHAKCVSLANIGLNSSINAARKILHFLDHNCRYLNTLNMAWNLRMSLPLNEWSDFAAKTGLEELSLEQCRNVGGNLAHLTAAELLTHLNLQGTKVTGDIGSLAALPTLMKVSLSDSSILGDLAPLSGLLCLVELKLHRTAVSGDVANLVTLVNLEVLWLYDTVISGNIGTLADLGRLKEMNFDRTAISGSIDPLAAISDLRVLSLRATKVEGSAMVLTELENIQELNLEGTSIIGDAVSLREEFLKRGVDVTISIDTKLPSIIQDLPLEDEPSLSGQDEN